MSTHCRPQRVQQHRDARRTTHWLAEGTARPIASSNTSCRTARGQAKAWAWAHVGLALTSVDGQTDFCPPIGPDPEEHAKARFAYVTGKWFWPLGEYIFTQYDDLRSQAEEAIEAMRNLSEQSLRTPSPSRDSLNAPGISDEPILPDALS